jgi:iron complex outermembrane recepter protein
MAGHPRRTDVRTSCAMGALLTATVLLPITAISANAQTPLSTVTIETPKTKVKAKAKPRRPEPVGQQAAETRRESPRTEEEDQGLAKPLTSSTEHGEALDTKRPTTSDTSSLIRDVPGVSTYGAGGVSGLPVIQGLADDRIKIMINGANISAACANHMNPPLSYVDPGQVKKIDVFTGVTPVSVGGDSIAGAIMVETVSPQFASPGEGVAAHGSLSSFVRSNGGGVGGAASASVATSNVGLGYTGAWTRSGNYEDGDGREVGATEFEAQNHALTLAVRNGGDLFVLEGGIQHIPYQGFVNQWMDMTLNDAWYLNGRYEGNFTWGKLDLRGFYHHTRHEMDFLKDKINMWAAMGVPGATMPMNTEGADAGYSVKAEIPLSQRDVLRVGNEFHHQTLDDWWPPVGDYTTDPMGMMCCDTFWNVNGGTRDRLGTFAEWERRWTPQWTTLMGLRNDIVWMNTGDVQGYSEMMYGAEADAFNAKDHRKTDVNFDVTALARYEANAAVTFEGGYARKTRSPSIYERYTWSSGDMSSAMVSWFGDANGYFGNIDLEPEVANKLSFTVDWHDSARKKWDIKVTPYYSYVQDFITADYVRGDLMMMGFNQLQFANHDAELYGVDISGRVDLGEVSGIGNFALMGVAGYVHGEDLETNGPLYHMMPWNAKLALEHKLGGWTNVVELQLVDDKTRVDTDRLEPLTPGYALVNLRTSYQWERLRFDVGVENVFDELYTPPLGGIDYTDYLAPGHAVPGMGRSIYAGVSMKF